MIGSTLPPQLRATPAPKIRPVPDDSDLSRTLGGPDAAGSPLAGGAMIQRLTHALTCAVSSSSSAQFSTEIARSDLLVHVIDLHLAQGQLNQAGALLATSTATGTEPSALTAAYLLSRQAELESRRGDPNERQTLQALWDSRHLWSDADLIVWVGIRRANFLSLDGEHAEAMQMLILAGGPAECWGPALHAAAGTLLRRQGNPSAAMQHLDQALPGFSGPDHSLQRALIALDRAACQLRLHHHDAATQSLTMALSSEQVVKVHRLQRALEELPDVLEHAILEPGPAEILTPILPLLQLVDRSGRVNPERITLLCLGRITVLRGRQTIAFATPWAPVLLAALAIEPGLTRRDLQELCLPMPPADAKRAVRSAIADLRQHVSPDVLDIDRTQNPPTYRLRPDLNIQVNLLECQKALQEHDLARAMLLYRGDVLPGLHSSEMIWRWRDQMQNQLTEALQDALSSALIDQEVVGLHPSAWVFEQWLKNLTWETFV